jgi:hypothetical protein
VRSPGCYVSFVLVRGLLVSRVGNCVGADNHRAYLMFITLASTASLLWAILYIVFLHTVGPTIILAAWGQPAALLVLLLAGFRSSAFTRVFIWLSSRTPVPDVLRGAAALDGWVWGAVGLPARQARHEKFDDQRSHQLYEVRVFEGSDYRKVS